MPLAESGAVVFCTHLQQWVRCFYKAFVLSGTCTAYSHTNHSKDGLTSTEHVYDRELIYKRCVMPGLLASGTITATIKCFN